MSNSANQRLSTLPDKIMYSRNEDIAQAGFFFFGKDDSYKCAFCNVVVSDWSEKDVAFLRHLEANPLCPFVMGHKVNNISLHDFSYLKSESVDAE